MKDVNQRQKNTFRAHYKLSNGQLSKKIIDRWKLGRRTQVNGAFYNIEKSRVINNGSISSIQIQ